MKLQLKVHRKVHKGWAPSCLAPAVPVLAQSNLILLLLLPVQVKVEEPDIVLVDNIEDLNTDALMLNADLSINLTQAPDRLSLVLIVNSLRGHTCKFDPRLREQTLVAFLQVIGILSSRYSSSCSRPTWGCT